ncbi:MAG: hypothetical protein A3G35_00665 [candidate division NC10 bacterium RIFCSPLOWO2_12_FULL_66_18]|jgi:hypothetical protein|nr:MAG: hypothetical protein A3H39_01460 [candidate division NC10 bacterium RIFCSPLOWO2_02_FULL_66_22]OGB96093.1 MAG: hypothetical protein A3G35_00665 [candidate division NC10 bacterium RIFCSPLOWO2_12_FULL_66_18]
MSAPKIPDTYTINSTMAVSGGLDLDLDNIRIKEIAPISLTSTSTLTSDSKLTSTSKVDMGLDDIRIKELPRIDLHVETAMKPTRIHFPVNLRFGLCTLGIELLAFCVCGESMVIVEDYVPHKTEVCA